MSYKLASIRIDLPVTFDLEQARTGTFEPAKVEAIFRQLEFRSLIEKLKKLTGASAPAGTQQLSLFGQEPLRVAEVRPASPAGSKLKTILVDFIVGAGFAGQDFERSLHHFL